MKAVIFDLDGTLADTEHRKSHLERHPKDWKSWNAAMHKDGLRQNIADLAHMFASSRDGNQLLLCTGRQEEHREITGAWLFKHKIWYRKMYMRATGDFRDDTIVKSEMLDQIIADGFKPWLVVDDRDKVIKMWRDRGLDALQCAPGNF